MIGVIVVVSFVIFGGWTMYSTRDDLSFERVLWNLLILVSWEAMLVALTRI
jgi:hypothetical protein